MTGPAATAAAWWARVRAAGPGRLAYEITLAAALPGVTAALSLVSGDLPAVAVAGLAVLGAVLVGLRRRFPATVLIVAAAAGAVSGALDTVLLFGLAFAAGYRVRESWRLALTLTAALSGQLLGWWLREGTTGTAQVLFTAGVFLVVLVFPATLARLSAQRRRILTLMHERTVYLSEQQQIVAERARVREAARIAREMHDSLGHRLTLISLYTGALRSAPERSEETLRLLHTTSTSAMDELRHILTVLREEAPGDEPRRDTTLADAGDLATDARAAGADAELVRTGETVTLPAMIDQAAYRTLQEGFTNALRHARGGAIRAAIRYEADALVVEVVNGPGRPHDGATGGQGLYGLAERVRIAGGVLYHGAEPGGGFRLAATLPLTSSGPRAPGPRADPVDFGDDLRRVDRRRRTWTVGAGLGMVLVLALCAGGLWLAVLQQTVDRATYDRVRIGDTTEAVRAELPGESAVLDPGAVVPTAAPGADCVTYRARATLRGRTGDRGYRFCFRAGALVAKETVDDV